MQLNKRETVARFLYPLLIASVVSMAKAIYPSSGIHISVYILSALGLIFATNRHSLPIFFILSFGHLVMAAVGYSAQSLWQNRIELCSTLLIVYVLMIIYSVFSQSWKQIFRIYVALALLISVSLIELLPLQRFILSMLSWPFLLSLLDRNPLQRSKSFLYFFPVWNSQFFHNVPTETGPHLFKKEVRNYQKVLHEVYILALWVLFFSLVKRGFDIAIWGLALDSKNYITGIMGSSFPRLLTWNYMANSDTPLLVRLVSIYIHFLSSFLHFIVLGTILNGMAKIWGYEFPLNVNFKKGHAVFQQWQSSFYYLNNLIVKLFFEPIYTALPRSVSRKLRATLAVVLSVLGFGYSYLFLLYNEWYLGDNQLSSVLWNRSSYLILICLLGGFKILTSRRRFISVPSWILSTISFLLVAPIIMFGFLTLDRNFWTFTN